MRRSYQSWGERVLPVAVQEPFTCREWVDLHSGAHPQPQPLARALTLTLPLTLPLALTLTLSRRVLWLGALAAPRPLPTRQSVRPCDPSSEGRMQRQPPPGRLSRTWTACAVHTAPCTPLARLYPVPPNPCPQTPCKVVEYLRGLLDTAAATLSAAERSKVETAFLRAVDIELAFFDNAYASA